MRFQPCRQKACLLSLIHAVIEVPRMCDSAVGSVSSSPVTPSVSGRDSKCSLLVMAQFRPLHLTPLHCARQGPAESSGSTFCKAGWPGSLENLARGREGGLAQGREGREAPRGSVLCARCFWSSHMLVASCPVCVVIGCLYVWFSHGPGAR